jgi:crotonobetainyl-CoA:carnitine CoA-transferase CaiB-like acyl-CoA transferase
MTGLLAGVRVLDLSGLLPGPYASLLLADMGAEVIKVESRLGDLMRQVPPMAGEESLWFLAFNRNKHSLGLDLRKKPARALFLDLVAESDVVIEGFRPGRAERLGVGPASCRAANRRLVYCSISGYGQTGPDAGRSGHDITYLARSGALGLFRTPDGAPVMPPLQIADLAAGTTAALAICAALVARATSGEGCQLDLSMLESVLPWLAGFLASKSSPTPLDVGTVPLAGRYPFYNVFPTADGGSIALGALEPLFWGDLCTVLERPDLVRHQFDDGPDRLALFDTLRAEFAARPTAEWAALFRAHDLPAEVVADLDDVLVDPHLQARGALVVVTVPALGPVTQVASPVRVSGAAPIPARPAPPQGADTRAILRRVLDLDEATIDNFFRDGVVFDAETVAPRRIAPEAVP